MRTWLLVLVMGCSGIDSQPQQVVERHAAKPDAQLRRGHHQKPRPPRPCKHDHKDKGTCSLVGTDGGTIGSTTGPTLAIPSGALTADTEITIEVSTTAAPSGALTPRYTFSPAGTVFNVPVAITLPVPAGTTNASLYWSKLASTGFDRRGGTISNDALHATVTHFSDGYVAPSSGPLHVTLSLVDNFYVAGVLEGQTYPPLAPFAPMFFASNGSGLVLLDPQPTPTLEAPGSYGLDLPSDTLAYQVGVTDPLYTTLYYAATGDIDIGTDNDGRHDAVTATTAVQLALDIHGLTTWDPSDQLIAAAYPTPTFWSLAGPATPTTSVVDTVGLPDDDGESLLIDATKGDVLRIVQLTPEMSGTLPYTAQTQVYDNASITQPDDGSTTSITAHLGNGHARTLSVDFHGDAFSTAFGLDSGTGIYTNLGPASYSEADSVEYLDPVCPGGCVAFAAPIDSETTATDLAYATSGALLHDSVFFDVGCFAQLQLSGTVSAAGATCDADGEVAAGTAIVPLLAPVGNVQFQDGQSAAAPANGVGTTPTLTWTSAADHHYIVLFELLGDSGDPTTKSFLASFTSNAPSLEIPPGLLIAGHHYALRITAEQGIDLQRLGPLPFSRVRWISDIFTP